MTVSLLDATAQRIVRLAAHLLPLPADQTQIDVPYLTRTGNH